jgi:uncharacterized FlgJ-related protein
MRYVRKFNEQQESIDPERDRKEIVQKVIDSLVKDQNNHPGYQSFREELEDFLNTFPKE